MNPAPGVKFPQQTAREAPAIIAGDDFAKLLNEVKEPYRTMVELVAATGLRIGELPAVRWRALDLEVGTLTGSGVRVRGQVPATEDAQVAADDSGGTACDHIALKGHRDRSTRKSDDDLVLPNKSGEPLRESKLERVARRHRLAELRSAHFGRSAVLTGM
jgi:site-specific recombinase XerC